MEGVHLHVTCVERKCGPQLMVLQAEHMLLYVMVYFGGTYTFIVLCSCHGPR